MTKIPGINIRKQAIPIRKVAIIGAGLMGGGIAMCFAQIGVEVILKDIKKEFLDNGIKMILANWKRSESRGRWSHYQVVQMRKLIKTTLSYENFQEVDMVIEAVFENMKTKKEIFTILDKVCNPNCVLATNTSTLDVDKIATSCSRPHKVIGMHFFSPANVMKLLENIRGKHTSDSTIATATQVGKKIGKVPVLVGNCFGFVGNRMIFPYTGVAARLVEEGCSPYDVDKAMIKFGMPMGPFQMSDLSGLDVGYKIRTENGTSGSKDPSYPFTIADKMYEEGLLGQKNKKGYYDYSKSRKGNPRQATLDLIEKIRREKGTPQRIFTVQDIQERLIFSLINEGMHCLEEGIAIRPMDIDVILMFGYGFPAQRGGPMFYCDEVGLKKVHDKISLFRNELTGSAYWEASALFDKCARKKIGIHEYYKKTKNQKKSRL